ncbi:MAG: SnoaL-like domain-containing protein [Planctomycetes bacterium]|nr:SnoaL-like domain-containing protein [Planctomycetota bacterium]
MPRHLLVALLLCPLPAYAAQEPDHEIHQELRAILATVQSSINAGNYDAMLSVVSKDIRATTINQEVMSSPQEVSAYFERWFGPEGYLKKLDMSLEADALTELSLDKTWGLTRGSGMERYTLADGRRFDMKTRWTATMAKESDGKWRLRAIHIGTDFLDNPLLAAAKAAVWKYASAAAAGGLLLGGALSFFLGRRKQ